jgi:hypothetical protein
MSSAERRSPAKFDEALVDDLASAPPTEASDREVKAGFDKAKLNELHAANEYRKTLVKSTQATVAALVTAATVFMGLYIWSQWDHVEASVMIAYFASVVAEVVGILYVIARYLFPSSGTK